MESECEVIGRPNDLGIYFPDFVSNSLSEDELYSVKCVSYYFDIFNDNSGNTNDSEIRSAIVFIDIKERGNSESIILNS